MPTSYIIHWNPTLSCVRQDVFYYVDVFWVAAKVLLGCFRLLLTGSKKPTYVVLPHNRCPKYRFEKLYDTVLTILGISCKAIRKLHPLILPSNIINHAFLLALFIMVSFVRQSLVFTLGSSYEVRLI